MAELFEQVQKDQKSPLPIKIVLITVAIVIILAYIGSEKGWWLAGTLAPTTVPPERNESETSLTTVMVMLLGTIAVVAYGLGAHFLHWPLPF